MKIKAFDYFDASKMLSEYSYEDKIKFYCTIGGIPHYLAQIDKKENFSENIKELMFNTSGYLYDEPMMLLWQELRESAMYNSIINAISTGASKLNEIATKIGEDRTKCIKYLQKLIQIGILHKEYPFGDNIAKSRKGIYKITDNYYNFWYRYVFTNKNILEQGNMDVVFNALVMPNLPNYIGNIHESICCQCLIRLNNKQKTPFVFTEISRWWGNNTIDKRQEEIDIIAASKIENKVIFAECKYRNELTDIEILNTLKRKSDLIKGYDDKYYMLFSKSGFTNALKVAAEKSKNIILIDLEKIFEI